MDENDIINDILEEDAAQELPTQPPESGPVLMRQALEAERRELEQQKAAFAARLLENAVGQELTARGLPEQFAPYLTGADEAESLERVEQFEQLFRQSITDEVMRRMRGAGAPREPAKSRGYSRERLRGMTASEINRNWDEIARSLEK